nr:CoA transferase subunit A [uncultured Cohaesibacter sp.]
MLGKFTSRNDIIPLFKDGMTIMNGGFANKGMPERIIDLVLESDARHLKLISNDTGDPNETVGRLVHEGRIDKVICSHIGMNAETVALYGEGKIEIEFCPQGSLMERIRAGGSGLGGVLTKTGLGTMMEEGKQIIEVDGEKYVLETALRADISMVRCRMADPLGNLTYRGTSRNTNALVAMAGDITIVDADLLLEMDEIGLDHIHTPGVFIDKVLAD